MRIADSKIEEIRTASDIVDVISAHVRLKKRGKNFLGLCPFHQEKTPSFSVSPEKQMYHCFGCGVGGNVFTFVMELEKVSFVEAIRTLAERSGIALPAHGGEEQAQVTENEALYNACRMAGLHFYENLNSTVEGKLALEYFHHRGFADATIRRFGLGYAMNSWDDLIRKAEAEGIGVELLDRAGLVVKREDGSGYHDRFRGRAMFPIFSPSGRPIGFGARKLREDDPLGKYINSPETIIYNKSRVLYGLYQAKDAIRGKEYAVLVEGYADLISVFQAGIENVVASSGTALTDEQIQLLGRYAKNVILVYDADSAGSNAALRGVDVIIENGLDVKVVQLPAGEDPDSFVKKKGGAAFQALLDSAVSFLDFKADLFMRQGLFDTPDGKTRAVRSIVETIAKMKDELKRNFYVKSVAEKYGIYESVLFRELEKLTGSQVNRTLSRKDEEQMRMQQQQNASALPQPAGSQLAAAERDLLNLMLEQGSEMVSVVFSHVDRTVFTHPHARLLAQMILDAAHGDSPWDASVLMDQAEDPALKHFIAEIVFSRHEISKGWGDFGSMPEEADPWKIARGAILALRKQELDRQIMENQHRIKEANAKGESVREFLELDRSLLQEKKELQAMRLGPQQPNVPSGRGTEAKEDDGHAQDGVT